MQGYANYNWRLSEDKFRPGESITELYWVWQSPPAGRCRNCTIMGEVNLFQRWQHPGCVLPLRWMWTLTVRCASSAGAHVDELLYWVHFYPAASLQTWICELQMIYPPAAPQGALGMTLSIPSAVCSAQQAMFVLEWNASNQLLFLSKCAVYSILHWTLYPTMQ